MALDFETIEPGQEVVRHVKPPITRVQLVKYAGASGDFTAFHLDHQEARAAGLDGVIAHGMMIMGFLTEAVTTWLPKKFLKRIKVRFKGMTQPGDVITIVCRVKDKRLEGQSGMITCSIEAVDQAGQVKTEGTFEANLSLSGPEV
ncbi:MAG: MaoC family dehydratase N-terminal domain-containing protein [Deltaproteobacteria bacterium]|nr:MaoC family dehydratase N-terminal domain-containing protein [Deltaproteobacteria bacterium]